MAATEAVGESQLQRIIKDLQDAVSELTREHRESGEPITDDSSNLHRFSYKLEYLLQFDQKEKLTFMGARKDYWDYFSDCLAKVKGANDGIRFVKSIPELKTSLGKGRAFIRYSLVHQRLADTLQQCLMNQKVTSDWYYTRSPLLKPHLSVDIISHLYELNEVQFDVASRGYDLDSAWPTFARRTLGGSPSHLWKPPSRSSSINSLVSSYSQVQEFPSSPDLVAGEATCGSVTACAVDDLRLELDQSELRQRELLGRVGELGHEAAELRVVVEQLQEQLDTSLAAQVAGRQELEALRAGEEVRRAEGHELRARLAAAEQKNVELLAKLDNTLDEKSQQAANHVDSAEKIHSLLDELSEAERARLGALRESEVQKQEAERLVKELRTTQISLAEEQSKTDRLQGLVTAKEKESGKLQRQLEEMQSSWEMKVCVIADEREKVQKEKEDLQQRLDSKRDSLEDELSSLRKNMKSKDEELSAGFEKIQLLEKQVVQLASEKQTLGGRVAVLESSLKDQARKTEDYKIQCASLMDVNSKLIQTVKKNEETKKELLDARAAKDGELAVLQANEKQLRSQIEDAAVAVDERERKLREENRHLDEHLRRAIVEKETSEGFARELDQEVQDMKKEQEATEAALLSVQEELRAAGDRVLELENSLATSQEAQVSLCKQLHETNGQLVDRDRQCRNLEGEMKALTEEKSDIASSLMMAQSQLELNTKEVSRLQTELLDLRAELRGAVEERKRTQELAALSRQLKEQEEELQHRHAETEESLRCAKEREGRARTELVSVREELCALKALNENLALDHAEVQEGLHRANTETAELGVTVCQLTSENHEARHRLEEMALKMESLNANLTTLQDENACLKEEAGQSVSLTQIIQELKGQLEQTRSIQEASQEAVEALRFQMSSEAMNNQNKLKNINDEVESLKNQLTVERDKVCLLEAKISQLEATNDRYVQQMEEKSVQIAESAALVRQGQEGLQQLKESLTRSEEELSAARRDCEELSRKLDGAVEERRDLELKTSAEIEDLCKTKGNLEERLIELIRDKDALWQKSDALEFEQKLRAEEQWWLVDKEARSCLGCRSPFTWWLRRHHCRLCGRIFCYYCSNNFAMTKHSGKKERCCRECYLQHCAVVERLTQAEVGGTQDTPPAAPCPASSLGPAPYTPMPRVTVTEAGAQMDDVNFDVITEDELNGIYDSDSASLHTGSVEISGNSSTGGATPDEPEELTPSLQDAEIHLLKSGELTSAVPLSVDDISQFGDGPRELLIRSSCYSMVPITVHEAGPTISWVFSSEPKSISFSVVYREGSDTPLEQAKVMIPLTRCNSHLETIQGQLKARNPGIYTLVFDNSYSRFISKKVVYHLTVEKPVIYDGSDL